jgi:hypothetical protein
MGMSFDKARQQNGACAIDHIRIRRGAGRADGSDAVTCDGDVGRGIAPGADILDNRRLGHKGTFRRIIAAWD